MKFLMLNKQTFRPLGAQSMYYCILIGFYRVRFYIYIKINSYYNFIISKNYLTIYIKINLLKLFK